jgi:hypothetical protein
MQRPLREITRLSLPLALALAGAGAGALYLAATQVLGAGAPANYTVVEIVAARHWCARAPHCVCLLRISVHCSACSRTSSAVGVSTHQLRC